MIVGIGIDTVSVPRIERILERRGERFLGKIFSEHEITEGMKLRKRAQFFAARFAAREAFFKALGTGFRKGFRPREVSVVNTKLGQPRLKLSGRLESELRTREINRMHLSITHEGDVAQAIVILENA